MIARSKISRFRLRRILREVLGEIRAYRPEDATNPALRVGDELYRALVVNDNVGGRVRTILGITRMDQAHEWDDRFEDLLRGEIVDAVLRLAEDMKSK